MAADSVSSRELTMQETVNNNVSMTISYINGNGNTVKQRGKKGSQLKIDNVNGEENRVEQIAEHRS